MCCRELVDDENITEIMVNGTGRIYIEKKAGFLTVAGLFFLR